MKIITALLPALVIVISPVSVFAIDAIPPVICESGYTANPYTKKCERIPQKCPYDSSILDNNSACVAPEPTPVTPDTEPTPTPEPTKPSNEVAPVKTAEEPNKTEVSAPEKIKTAEDTTATLQNTYNPQQAGLYL